ncbi:MAG: SGNH/GDSL hydrolase family protein [Acidobacteriota bacterium]
MRWLCVLAFAMAVVSAQAAGPVNRLYVFGDSYSDMGRGWTASNGPTAVVYLAQRLGLEMVASTAKDISGKSLDFAVSGAITGRREGLPYGSGVVKLGMENQVDEFAAMVKAGTVSFDPATTLFFIAGGLNDFKAATGETVSNLESEVATLYGCGARRFEVAILPETVPDFADVAVRLNPALAGIPAEMRGKLKDAEITTSRWGADYDDVMKHAAQYGFKDTKRACAMSDKDPKPCVDPESHYYYFASHPSTAVHKIVGDMLYDEVQRL